MVLLFIWKTFGYVPCALSNSLYQRHYKRQEQVQTNKDLDLPTQQELLAQFRCDEISTAALVEFNEQAKSQKRPIEAGRVVEGLGALMKNWRDQTLGTFPRQNPSLVLHKPFFSD